jgi:hypothetical protein
MKEWLNRVAVSATQGIGWTVGIVLTLWALMALGVPTYELL